MSAEFTSAPTTKTLLKMSIPITLGMISTILFQLIDAYFIGMLGSAQLAALGFASSIYFILIYALIGLGLGQAILIGNYAGGDDLDSVQRTAMLGQIVAILSAMLAGWIGLLTIEPLFASLGATPEVIEHVAAYMTPLYWGLPLLSISISGDGALRAVGSIRLPALLFGIAGLINALLDYAFIFGAGPFPELGIAGVAYGTVISWAFLAIAIGVMMMRNHLISAVLFQSMKNNLDQLRTILKMDLPTVVTQLITPATILWLTYILGQNDELAVASYGVAGRIETLLMIGVMAVSTAATPFISQNLGAHAQERIDEAIVFGGKTATYLGILIMLVMFALVTPIAGIFTDDAQIIEYTELYFYLVPISYALYGLYLISAAVLNGLQRPNSALKIMSVKTFVFTIPLTFGGSLIGVEGVFIGLSLSNILGGLYARRIMSKTFQELHSGLLERSAWSDYRKDLYTALGNLAALLKNGNV